MQLHKSPSDIILLELDKIPENLVKNEDSVFCVNLAPRVKAIGGQSLPVGEMAWNSIMNFSGASMYSSL